MKVVLLKDDRKLGRKGAVVDVADGFALSSLIPQGIAEVVTPGKNHHLQHVKKTKEKNRKQNILKAEAIAEKISNESLIISSKADGEKLFGSIGRKEVATVLKSKYNVDIEEKSILLDDPIRTLDTRDIKIQLADKIRVTVTIKIIAA